MACQEVNYAFNNTFQIKCSKELSYQKHNACNMKHIKVFYL